MNVVFWLLIFIAVFFAWFILSFLFRPLGRFFMRLFNDAMEQMKETEEEKKGTDEK